jgi:hypothetical protein
MKNISTQGYKRDSPDKNRPYNVIPSSEITMKGVDFPVLGIDNLGNRKLMHPGEEHSFRGNMVLEIPMKSNVDCGTWMSKHNKSGL